MTWLDAPTWVHEQMAALPYEVQPERDGIRFAAYPAIIWSLSLANPEPLGIWTGVLTVQILAKPSTSKDAIGAVTDLVGGWQTPGPIHGVELTSYIADPTEIARNVHRYILTYSLTWDI